MSWYQRRYLLDEALSCDKLDLKGNSSRDSLVSGGRRSVFNIHPVGAGLLLDSFVLLLGLGPPERLPKPDERSEGARHTEEEALREGDRKAK